MLKAIIPESLKSTLNVLFGDIDESEVVAIAAMSNDSGAQCEVMYVDKAHFEDAAQWAAIHDRKGGCTPHICTGIFDRDLIIDHLATFDAELNKPYMLQAGKGQGIKQSLVKTRRFLFLDFDPISREGDVQETRNKVEEFVRRISADLWAQGFGQPIVGISGYGFHLYYRIDQPNDDDGKAIVEALQVAIGKIGLRKRSFCRYCKMDVLPEASRLAKFYGVKNRKGGKSQNTYLESQESQPVVPYKTLIEFLGGKVPSPRTHITGEAVGVAHVDSLIEWLQDRRWVCEYAGMDESSHKIVMECPYDAYGDGAHSSGTMEELCFAVWVCPNGSLTCQCFHACITKDDRVFNAMDAMELIAENQGEDGETFKEFWEPIRKQIQHESVLALLSDSESAAAIVFPPPTVSKFGSRQAKQFAKLLNDCIAVGSGRAGHSAKIELLCWTVGQGIEPNFLWSQVDGKSVFDDRQQLDDLLDEARREWQCREYESRTVDRSVAAGDGEESPEAFAAKFLAEKPMHQNDHEWFMWDGTGYAKLSDKDAQRQVVTRWLIDKYDGIGVTMRLAGDVLNAAKALATTAKGEGTCYWVGKPEVEWDLRDCIVTPTQIVNLATRETHPTSPALFCSTPIEIEYDPSAMDCPVWEKTLRGSWEHDRECRDTLQEWFGYCLTPDTSQQKILYLKGPGRSGKGTIARALKQLLGEPNVTGLTAGTFSNPHGKQVMVNKSLGICGDARFSRHDEQAVVESLLSISGEDVQYINPKGVAAYSATLPTRLMMLSNDLPYLRDASGVLTTRFIFLIQTKSFLGNEDAKLEDKLKSELPAILNWAIEGWERLRKRGRFVEPASSASTRAVMGETTSPISTFIEKYCVVEPGARERKQVLYMAYRDFMLNLGNEHLPAENSFARLLLSVVPGLDTNQKMRKAEVDELNDKIREENMDKRSEFEKRSEIKGRPPLFVGVRLKTQEELATDDVEVVGEVADEFAHDDFFNHIWNLDDPNATLEEFREQGKNTTLLLENMVRSGVEFF